MEVQYQSERRILEAELQNTENEQDILRDQLANKENALLKKHDELSKVNDTAHNRLFSGNGNLTSKAKAIQKLGVKGKKNL